MHSLDCDVLVIGGGATGAGVLLDLALRGLRVVLVEQNDLASGTSGRYHGLLHSGARYVVRDPASARECIEENMTLRRIAPHAIEDTGGLFVSMRPDDPAYIGPWLKGCAQAGIPVEQVPIPALLKEVPALDPTVRDAYRVPDAACDSFDLLHAIVEAATALGAQALTYHRLRAFELHQGRVVGATVEDRRGGAVVRIHAAMVVNAAGPWAGEVGKLAGAGIGVSLSKGIMVAMNSRWVNTILNRLNTPGDGDILVPVGTVCVIGTTSVTVPRPDDLHITADEVTAMLDAGEVLIPGFRKARALRAWAGVRPLYEAPHAARAHQHDEHHADLDDEGRWITRTFSVIDHASEGIAGLVSIVGGKLTTYRLMAEQISDHVCAALGVQKPCRTAQTALPKPAWAQPHGVAFGAGRYHALPARWAALEQAPDSAGLICECEVVTRPQIEAALQAARGSGRPSLDDLRRDLRLGMGPCQGGFCAYRAAGILQEHTPGMVAAEAADALAGFLHERFRGNRPLLWGHQLRQALLDEAIYRRCVGLPVLPASPPPAQEIAITHAPQREDSHD